MTRIRHGSARPLGAVIVLLAVSGCGGAAASGGTASTQAAPSPAASNPDGNGGGSTAPAPSSAPNGNGGSAEEVGKQLAPPNSTEISRTTGGNFWYVIYESSDSPDDLKSYYEGKVPDVGMTIISTTSIEEGHSMVVSRDDAGTFGGAIGLIPVEGGSGTTVTISIGSN